MKLYIIVICLCILALFAACQSKGSEDAHAHVHDDVAIPYTGYSRDIEVFADVEPLAFQSTSELIVHFTNLSDFKPVAADSVTMELISGGKGIRLIRRATRQPGIFKFSVTPVFHGRASLRFLVHTSALTKEVSIPDVVVFQDAHNAVHEADGFIPVVPNAISFTKENAWKVNFATDSVQRTSFGAIIKTVAQVEAAPLDKELVSARTSGFVNFMAGAITPGKPVGDGDQVLTVIGSGLTEDDALVLWQQVNAEYEVAQSDYERARRLSKQHIVSEKQLQESKARYEKIQLQWNNLKNTIHQTGEKIVSPAMGNIHEVFVGNDQYVEAGSPLFSMVRNKRLVLKAMINQKYLPQLNQLIDAHVETSEGFKNLVQLNGKILSVSHSISPLSHMVPVFIELDYQPELVSGGFASVYLKMKDKNAELVVPETALIEEQGSYFVFVQLTPELYEKREVKVGASDGMQRVILSGLSETQRIVTKGAILVKLAAVSNSIDPHAGHVH